MLEKQLIAAINRALPSDVYSHSNTYASMTGNGIPDRFYDGPGGSVWIEFKQLKSMPRSGMVVGAYTELQLQWMERRYRNSKHLLPTPDVAGVVGLPNRTAVIQRTPTEWREGTPLSTALPLKEIAWVINSGWLSRAASAASSSAPLPFSRRTNRTKPGGTE